MEEILEKIKYEIEALKGNVLLTFTNKRDEIRKAQQSFLSLEAQNDFAKALGFSNLLEGCVKFIDDNKKHREYKSVEREIVKDINRLCYSVYGMIFYMKYEKNTEEKYLPPFPHFER